MSLQNKCAKCGCEDSYLTTPPPCPTAIGCPFEECAEIQYAQCIMYTGGDILCGDDLVVPTDTNMEAAITNVVDYFCGEVANINDSITAIEGDITTIEGNITTIQGDITTIEGDITAIEGDITTIEGNIATLQANQGLFDTGFRAALNPTLNVDTVTASLVNANVAGGVIIIMPVGDINYQIVDGVTTPLYNTTTGIWTCPQTGKYDINYNVYLTCPDQTGFGWGNTPTTTGGAYSIAVTNPGVLGGTVYCADTFFVIKGVYCSRIYLTGGMQGVTLTAGTQIVLRHQNMTGINYVADSGDNIDWAIRRVG